MINYNINSDGKHPVKMWTKGVMVEDEAITQLVNLANMPFIHKHVAVMPDVHKGIGSTIGSVIVTKQALIPAACGVDIGCSVSACKLNIKASDLPDNLHDIRTAIEKVVPHGRTDNGGVNDRGAWHNPSHQMTDGLKHRLEKIIQKTPVLERPGKRAVHQLGTLGTGNHFIEMCLDLEDNVWLMLHSGSRGIGNSIGRHFIELAKEDMKKWFINLPDKDLAYLPEGTDHFNDYVEAMLWAQDYALENHRCMMINSLKALNEQMNRTITIAEKVIQCHHNYSSKEHHYGENVWVTRKGAVRARKDDLGIIPGSMGAKSFIVRGLGNPESFCSCSHGAGRIMSRTKAKATFTVDEHVKAMVGIEARLDKDVLDETPGAYKPIADVMAAQTDLVEVVTELHQILNIKG